MKYIILFNIVTAVFCPIIACKPHTCIVCHTIKGYQHTGPDNSGLNIYVDAQAPGTGARIEFSYDNIVDTIPVLDTANLYNYTRTCPGAYNLKAVLIAGNKLRIDSIDIPAFNLPDTSKR